MSSTELHESPSDARSAAFVIETIGLQKNYPGVCAIDGVGLTVNRGEVVCVIGPNGSGKTTLLYLLAGLLYPSAGHVRVFGLHRWQQSYAIRQRSAVLPATPVIGASPTPYEYLRYVAQVYGLPKAEFLTKVHRLAGEMNYLPHLKRPWEQLSLGLTKKAGLIGCFLPAVELRILDEPFAGGIDPLGMEVLYRWFSSSRLGGETIIFSTQVLEQAQDVSDRILLLRDGHISVSGSPLQLLQRAGVDPAEPRALARAFIKLSDAPQPGAAPNENQDAEL